MSELTNSLELALGAAQAGMVNAQANYPNLVGDFDIIIMHIRKAQSVAHEQNAAQEGVVEMLLYLKLRADYIINGHGDTGKEMT